MIILTVNHSSAAFWSQNSLDPSQKASQSEFCCQDRRLQDGLAAVDAATNGTKKLEPEGHTTDMSDAPAVAKTPNKGEQVPGRKGVSSKLHAIREKYNPGDDNGQSQQRYIAQQNARQHCLRYGKI